LKKSVLCLVTFFVLLVSLSYPAFADDYGWFSLGFRGSIRSFSLGRTVNDHFAFEGGYMQNNKHSYDSYPYSTSYDVIDGKNDDAALGFDLLWYPVSNYRFYIGIGAYSVARTDVVRSNSTPDPSLYKKNRESVLEVPLSIGYQYQMNHLKLGAGYHMLRGFNAQILFNLP
jgi:hypothetical protein